MRTSLTLALFAWPLLAAPRLDYGRDIRPILSENCFHCHGQDSQRRMANLRLDTAEGALARHALVPGKPADSVLYQRVTSENARRMPPLSSNRRLTPEQISLLKRWIEEGGEYSRHWAFVPPVRPTVPADREPIDYLVRQRLQTEGLTLSRPADPAVWLRRVTFDLTGLPPTPSELDAFSKNPNYAATVDRLLASSRYGERMAMDWLDVARYADTHGFNNDSERSMWRWRDWVIESFNRNLPYNRFITEQLAGDLLPNPTLDQRLATGFGRNHVINSEGGIIDEEYRVEYVSDRVRTLGMAWLGITLECARCHDHKYDPISQRDHYRFFAFFNNIPEVGEDGRVANAVPMMAAPTATQQARLAQLEASMAALTPKVQARAARWHWRKAALPAPPMPTGAALQIDCDSGKDYALVEGIAGQACAPKPEAKPVASVDISRRQGMTFSAWLQPNSSDTDAPLLSAIDYSKNPASVGYGNGIEFRLVNGELEFRSGQRFPAYSIRVRSEGAALTAGQWRHVALLYAGATPQSMRAEAAWVRIFVDGRELPVRVLNDGCALPDAKTDKPSPTRFRVGWDTAGARYAGRFDDLSIWTRALDEPRLASLFRSRALPYASARATPSAVELAWLRDAALPLEDKQFAALSGQLTQARAEWLALRRASPLVMVMEELPKPRQTHVLNRGAYDLPGEKVSPEVPEQLLGAWPAGAPKNRLGLAQWLTKPDHPLTARVVVNRFWQQIFGQGLVKTSENFGVQGESPSNPELLDWLAREFIDSGWDVKALWKRILLSSVYRQDSAASPELLARDPENRLLARGPRVRLPAEAIRDAALQASGLLSEKIGGPSVYPYQPPGLYKGIVVAAEYPGTVYTESTGADLHRRSLYTFWKRTVPHPTLTVFDAPDREFCIVRRSSTNTPLQALTLLNDPIFVEAARKLAERAILEGGATPESRLAYAFRLAVGHAPEARDLAVLTKSLARMRAAYLADEKAAAEFLAIGAAPRNPKIPLVELAAYAAVANMILNLDETITKG
ncbi:MAG: DUF1553 domain-containing protein [Bryobacteraceae bacterium]|nr:DUF1553 domain-containing protein [Bryobacteraceae bacterium]